MNRVWACLLGCASLVLFACNQGPETPETEVQIPEFNFPKTVAFEQNLSAYYIFEGPVAELTPSEGFHLLELSSVLFTDYAHKQRLVKVPAGTQMTRREDGSIDFPNGTILTKTFFYYLDERDPTLGKRIIETRLLIKENDAWNVATYLWNQAQTEATLALNGLYTEVNWIAENGTRLSTRYHVPTENECMTCHQSSSRMSPLGPTLRNLNREVERNSAGLNQLRHLQALGVLNDFELSQVPQMVDYKDATAPLAARGKAYLAMNCAHCHHPEAWEASAERDFDLRYETPIA
ncbi:MAG: hypothetical protein AAF804_06220, partial [Bacteroidota bacterium]